MGLVSPWPTPTTSVAPTSAGPVPTTARAAMPAASVARPVRINRGSPTCGTRRWISQGEIQIRLVVGITGKGNKLAPSVTWRAYERPGYDRHPDLYRRPYRRCV